MSLTDVSSYQTKVISIDEQIYYKSSSKSKTYNHTKSMNVSSTRSITLLSNPLHEYTAVTRSSEKLLVLDLLE